MCAHINTLSHLLSIHHNTVSQNTGISFVLLSFTIHREMLLFQSAVVAVFCCILVVKSIDVAMFQLCILNTYVDLPTFVFLCTPLVSGGVVHLVLHRTSAVYLPCAQCNVVYT